MNRDDVSRCPVCESSEVLDLLRIDQVPVYCNVLWPDKQQALAAACGEMALGFCTECAHLFNTAFDQRLTDYTAAYDNSLHYSPRFNQYAEQLAASLVQRHALHGKRIVEIGCGKGDFLRMLSVTWGNQGFGFDRSFEPGRADTPTGDNIQYFQDFYNAEYARLCNPDFLCCRHVLEHIEEPLDFLRSLRGSLDGRTDVSFYCEVPNGLFTLKDLGIWDLIYEHCGYFSLNSLSRAFSSSGFDVVAADESFGGQFIWVEARPADESGQRGTATRLTAEHVRQYADSFASQYRATVDAWRDRLSRFSEEGRRAVVWGAGSKGVTFLNIAGIDAGIDFVVDVNPHKQGRYIAGTGQQVVSPEALRGVGATDVIVMNPMYLDEVTAAVLAMGLDLQVVSVQ